MTLRLINATPFACGRYALTAKNGATFLRIVVKGSFDILPYGNTEVARVQQDIVMEDEYWGKPGASSVKYESDLLISKPGTDLIVHGEACAPMDRPVTAMRVGLAYRGRVLKELQVSGDRIWRRGVLGWSPSSPKPFTRMPVVYDRAFGGADESGSEPRNRSGMGYSAGGSDLADRPVPNIEFPDELISAPSERPPPAGFGVISRHWMPRMRYAGTYDAAWIDKQFPLLPADFDDRFFHSAAEDQWIAAPKGGEEIAVAGMSPEGTLRVRLPPCTVPVTLRYTDRTLESLMQPETVLLDAGSRLCTITWGAIADIHGDPFRLKEVCVGEPKALPKPRCAAR